MANHTLAIWQGNCGNGTQFPLKTKKFSYIRKVWGKRRLKRTYISVEVGTMLGPHRDADTEADKVGKALSESSSFTAQTQRTRLLQGGVEGQRQAED